MSDMSDIRDCKTSRALCSVYNNADGKSHHIEEITPKYSVETHHDEAAEDVGTWSH
jgi:hypothetical protein